MPFNFHLISTEWQPKAIASLIEAYEAALPVNAWPNWVLGNHDRSRVASRIGPAQARVAAMLLLTLRGTPTIYQGDEIGMADVEIPASLVQDPLERNVPGFGLGRDPVRTPMPWISEQQGGFTQGRPWLPLNADADVLNVYTQSKDLRSILSLYRALIRLRRNNDVLSLGEFSFVGATDYVLAYERRLGDQHMLIALNMTDQAQIFRVGKSAREALLSTCLDDACPLHEEEIHLRANEGLVLRALPDVD